MKHTQPTSVRLSPACDCGHPDAYWHGDRNGQREYMCKSCWDLKTAYKGIVTEITAGMCLKCDDQSKAYNDACERAVRIVERYARGEGLFQDGENRETIVGNAEKRDRG